MIKSVNYDLSKSTSWKVLETVLSHLKCAVEDQGETSERFDIKTGVKGFLLLIVTNWVMQREVAGGENGIRWKLTLKLDDLDFADDIVLLSSTKQQIQHKTTRLDEEARRMALSKSAKERQKR